MKLMLRLPVLLVFVDIASVGLAQQPAQTFDPTCAMVRIQSHGASATAIATTANKTWILGCAHMLMDKSGNLDRDLYNKVLKMDGPPQPNAVNQGKANARIVAYDLKLDLTLIELDNGPFHCIPVAKKGFKPSKNIRSLGYDSMAWPVAHKAVTILLSEGDTTYTREKPWHGRSGGALVDADAGVLIGVVQGYELWPNERGLYVSHDAILRFLEKHFLPDKQDPAPLRIKLPLPRLYPLPGC